MKTTILFYPNEGKKSKKNNQIPIYLRLLHQGFKKEKRLNITIKECELTLWNENLFRLNRKDSPVNTYLNIIESEYNKWNTEFATNPNKLNIEELMERLTGEINKQNENNIICFFDWYFQERVLKSSFTKGTIKNYKKSINHFFHFLKIYKLEHINISAFSRVNAIQFKDYLLIGKHPSQKSLQEHSASSVIKQIKIIFGKAFDYERIVSNPFSQVSLSNKYEQRQRLNIQDVKKIIDLDLSKHQNLTTTRDAFIFCCLTGLAFSDFNDLRKSNLREKENDLILETKRNKTTVSVKQFLPEYAKKIVEKYNDNPSVLIENRLFPKIELGKTNSKLKVIAALAQIDINISTHIARHTFKQLLAEAEISEGAALFSIMGWSTVGNIALNYTSPTETLLMAAKKKFDIYLNENL